MDIRTLSRWTGALSLIAAPVIVGLPITSESDTATAATQIADTAAHLGLYKITLAQDFGAVLMLVAVLCAARLARRGAPRLAFWGGLLSFTGWLAGLLAFLPLDVARVSMASYSDRAAAVVLYDKITGNLAVSVTMLLFVVLHVVGGIVLGIALWRSRAVPAAAGILVAVAPVAHFVAHMAGFPLLDSATFLLLLLGGFAVCAARVVRLRNDEWDLPAAAELSHEPVSV
ncbi:MAG: hypothetical protein JWN00_592 [Actinomycetia bacterium]|nr:hypothetical protein [Actinomycetes bacterium]